MAMPMRPIDQFVEQRIRRSPLTLTIITPAVRPVAVGAAPGVAPLSPLTGPAPVPHVVTTEPVPYEPPLTVACLWLDMATGTALGDGPGDERTRFSRIGWVPQATAVARVLVADVALDPAKPYGGTRFDRADHVEYQGGRFRVLQTTPIAAGNALPTSYYIWLVGSK
jgi:hypothetical protein